MITPPNQREVVHSQQPIPQITNYRSEIKSLLSLDEYKAPFWFIYCGLVFPRWKQPELEDLFNPDIRKIHRFQSSFGSNMIIGHDLLQPLAL